MTQAITLKLPDQVVRRIQQIADHQNQPVERVLLDSLNVLYGEEDDDSATLEQISHYTNDQLWAVVHRPMAAREDARLELLGALAKRATLTDEEEGEFAALIRSWDRWVQRRSVALATLQERGEDVDSFFKQSEF